MPTVPPKTDRAASDANSSRALSDSHLATLHGLVRKGYQGYRELLVFLAGYLSPDEIHDVEKNVHGVLRIWRAVLATAALFVCVVANLLPADGIVGTTVLAIGSLAPLLAALPLISLLRMPHAAVTLFVLFALHPQFGIFVGPIGQERSPFTIEIPIGVAFKVCVAYLFALLVEYCAETTPSRTKPIFRRVLLFLLLVCVAYLLYDQGLHLPAGAVLLLAITWPTLVIALAQRLQNRLSTDCVALRRIALERWTGLQAGRVATIIALAMIFFAFLNSFALNDRLRSVMTENQQLPVHSAPSQKDSREPLALYWPRKERIFSAADLHAPASVYQVNLNRREDIPSELRSSPVVFMPSFEHVTAQRCLELLATFQGGELTNYSDILKALTLSKVDPVSFRVMLVERVQTDTSASRPDERSDGKEEGCLIERLDESIIFLTPRYLDQFAVESAFRQMAIALFGILAFGFLWRRGGDSASALFLGSWFAGAAIVVGTPLLQLTYPPLIEIATSGVLTPMQEFVAAVVQVMHSIAWALGFFFLAGILLAYGLVSWFWSHSTLGKKGLANPMNLVGAIAIWFALTLIATGWQTEWTTVAMPLGPVVVCTLWYFALDRVASRRVEHPQPWKLSQYVFLTVAFTTLTVSLSLAFSTGAIPASLASLALGGFLLLCTAGYAAVLLFKEGFLQVRGRRNLAYLIVAFMLPVLLEWLTDYMQRQLQLFGIHSEFGALVVSAVISIAVLQEVRKRLTTAMERIGFWDLPAVRKRVHEVLEVALSGEDPAKIETEMRMLFHELGIHQCVYYVRTTPTEFTLLGASAHSDRTLRLSVPLQEKLSREAGFVDLNAVPFQWTYMFDQFELYWQVQLKTSLRFLLPLRVGSLLYGLVLMSGGEHEERLAQDWFADASQRLGMVRILRLAAH